MRPTQFGGAGSELNIYNCSFSGFFRSMEVKGLTCGKCESELVYAEIGDNSIGVSQCPNGCGKIKSPMCCGTDMSPSN